MDRVQKLLGARGYCSRRKAEELIAAGRVTVNGKTVHLGDSAEEQDELQVDGKIVAAERKVYLLFHKPVGCVTAVTDKHEKTVLEYVKVPERVFPVGRLDKETSGLLLLTNDGDFANSVAHPRYEVEKTYVAQLDRPVRDSHLKRLKRGVQLEDGKTSPADAKLLAPSTVELTIHEGRNRVVRRMFAALGYDVVALHRIRVGKLTLGDLRPGEWKELKAAPGKGLPDV